MINGHNLGCRLTTAWGWVVGKVEVEVEIEVEVEVAVKAKPEERQERSGGM